MSKDSNSKKPRAMFVGVGIEAGTDLDFTFNKEEQTVVLRAKKEGKTIKPVNTTIGMSYDRPDRPDKGPKVITMLTSCTRPLSPVFDETLSTYTIMVPVSWTGG